MRRSIVFWVRSALIAAVYVVLTIVFSPFSFGEIQVRIAEMLTVLPLFTGAAVPGLFVGCLLGNTLGGAPLPDILFGSLATLIGAAGTYALRSKGVGPAILPPIAANTLIIPWILRLVYRVALPIPLMMLTVGVGESLSVGLLGSLFAALLKKHEKAIFGQKS